MKMYNIGIDLGGTKILFGLINKNFEIVKQIELPTRAFRPSNEIIETIADGCKQISVGIEDQIDSIGIASPGFIDNKNGVVLLANNLHFENYPILSILKEALPKELSNIPLYIENDANAAALAEATVGAAKETESSIMITLGTGVGGGIILNGKIYKGFNSVAGEIGHMVIEKYGRACSCGHCGCFEAYASATALIKRTEEMIKICEAKELHTILSKMAVENGISGKTAFDAMRAGDRAATEIIESYISYLATGIINLINIFQPEVISIGGGISNEGDYLLKPLLQEIRLQSIDLKFIKNTEIKIAQLKNTAGIIGAAILGK